MPKTEPAEACATLLERMKTLQLATLGEGNEPHCGYTPFVKSGNDFVVFISQLAVHTRDLLANNRVGVMIVDDEQESSNLFARCRARYQCKAVVIEKDAEEYEHLLSQYQERQGKIVSLLRELPDFVLFRLKPDTGVFVVGFGEAYRIEGDNMDTFVHIRSA